MSSEYRKRLEAYYSSIQQARLMLKMGIIDDQDFIKMEDKMAKKYCIKICSLYRSNDLINRICRGNMTHDLEVS